MSSDQFEKLKQDMEKANRIGSMQDALKEHRVQTDYDQMEKAKRQVEFYKNIDLDKDDEEDISSLEKANFEYMMAARKKMPFICDDFMDVVPYFPKNLILIGAKTGDGKSTSAANLIYSTLKHKKKILVLTNEESRQDIYNRITCLCKGWIYTNHDKFSDEQIEVFNSYMRKLKDFVKVVDDKFQGNTGVTTTLEGVKGILENIVEKGNQFDVIIIDYIQNISSSSMNPRMEKWQVLQRLCEYLNSYKERYMAPIVMFAQLHNDSSDKTSFEERLKGFKGMMEPMTCVLEVRPDKKAYRSEWVIHKSRWASKAVSHGFFTGWYKGLYVSVNNQHYVEWVRDKIMERARSLLDPIIKEESDNGQTNSSGT